MLVIFRNSLSGQNLQHFIKHFIKTNNGTGRFEFLDGINAEKFQNILPPGTRKLYENGNLIFQLGDACDIAKTTKK